MFLSRKEWKSSILWRILFILTGYLGVIHFGNGMLISKKFVLVMCSFKGIMIVSKDDLQPSILSTVPYIFSDVKICFCQRTFFQRISEYQLPWIKLLIKGARFPEQHRLYWNESCHFFWSGAFFNANIFQHNYCFREACSSEYLIIQNIYFFEAGTSSTQLLFRGRNV